MRSPQYGKGKRPVAPDADYAFRGAGRPFAVPAVTVRTEAPMYGRASTKRLRGDVAVMHTAWGSKIPNAAVKGSGGLNVQPPARRIRYNPPATVLYSDGTTGAPVSLVLNHKSAQWRDGQRVDEYITTIRAIPLKIERVVINVSDDSVTRSARYRKGEKVERTNPVVTKPYTVVKTSHRV